MLPVTRGMSGLKVKVQKQHHKQGRAHIWVYKQTLALGFWEPLTMVGITSTIFGA